MTVVILFTYCYDPNIMYDIVLNKFSGPLFEILYHLFLKLNGMINLWVLFGF